MDSDIQMMNPLKTLCFAPLSVLLQTNKHDISISVVLENLIMLTSS